LRCFFFKVVWLVLQIIINFCNRRINFKGFLLYLKKLFLIVGKIKKFRGSGQVLQFFKLFKKLYFRLKKMRFSYIKKLYKKCTKFLSIMKALLFWNSKNRSCSFLNFFFYSQKVLQLLVKGTFGLVKRSKKGLFVASVLKKSRKKICFL